MTGEACTATSGCQGTIEDDGYCSVCGLPPAPPASIRYARTGRAAGGQPAGGPPAPGPFPSGPLGSGSLVSGPLGAGSLGSGSLGTGSLGTGSLGTGSLGTGSLGTGSGQGTRGSRRGSGRSSRGRLGAGLVEVPSVPSVDPASAILSDPVVPESRRRCSKCNQLVGQSRDGRPGPTEGYCAHCGTRYSFTPKLRPGELVAGQYEVLGCLAHGGLGWIYLARDRNVSDRWVVLKGLLNTGDVDAMEAAAAERRFLAQLEHPNIVRIYNFVNHANHVDGEASGYIVMEYVAGKSLRQIRLDARQYGGPLPLAHALAYVLEILPAFGFLHERGLVYCDFKPDNVMQSEEQLKLIDMGGVRSIDGDGAIYGTVGYQAPEIKDEDDGEGPSPSSDLYTIGRSLAVLTFDFVGFQTQYRFALPPDEPLLAAQQSFARLLRRATHADPRRRFQSAGEMAEQVTGVLREVLSLDDGQPRPAFSGLFSPELRGVGADLAPVPADGGGFTVTPPSAAEVIAGLPAPLADGTDPAAGYLATLGGLEPAQQAQALLGAVNGDAGVPPDVAGSHETRLALARALIAAGDLAPARDRLAELAAAEAEAAAGAGDRDWRIAWYTGLLELAAGRPDEAAAAFGLVYDELPGEIAPKLALGFAYEAGGQPQAARYYFQRVWTIDRSYASAGFGMARACLASGDRISAIAAVAAMPETSSYHAAAQIAAVRLLVATGRGTSADDLYQADQRLGRLGLEDNDPRRQQLGVEILRAALDWVAAVPGGPPAVPASTGSAAAGRILGCEPNERALRLGLERGYRALANLVPERRIELVDLANSVRPRTLI
jgi:serine/threonine-protein kinase PknG